jgi:hypothetical protein
LETSDPEAKRRTCEPNEGEPLIVDSGGIKIINYTPYG